jgi:Domain of unknown function (DUF4294)
MQRLYRPIFFIRIFILPAVIGAVNTNIAYSQTGKNDTLTTYAVIYNGDTIEAKTLSNVDFYARYTDATRANKAKWTRLRNAIIVTYPYAMRSGTILNDMNAKLAGVTDKSQRKEYIKTREKELKKEFTDPLSNLSIYQGKVLMKLINRQTGNNCYDIIKEYRGGLTARLYQTVAFFFSSNLKQPYDIRGEEREMEIILREVCSTYGFNYSVQQPSPVSF